MRRSGTRAAAPRAAALGRPRPRLAARQARDEKHDREANVVKHFKWEPRGKLRIHSKPNAREVAACLPWLRSEVDAVRPKVVIALGATAAQALLGPRFRVTRERGKVVQASFAGSVVATVHPAAILRAPDQAARRRETERFIADLRAAAKAQAEQPTPARRSF
jgi:DNA polymerase